MSESDVNRERQPGGSDGAPSVVVTPAQHSTSAPGSAGSAPQGTTAGRVSGTAPATGDATSTGGVNTLRAILLGGPSRTPDDTRLTAIERRLDTLSLQMAREPRAPASPTTPATAPLAATSALTPEQETRQETRLAEIERRLDTQGAQLDAAGAAARGGDVTLGTLADLQRQVEALRQEHTQMVGQMAEQTAARLREADERCRARQLRTRTTRRQELLRLRRRVYAPAGTLAGTANRVPAVAPDDAANGVAAPVWPVAPESRPLVVAVAGSPGGSTAMVARATAVPAHTIANIAAERDQHATIRRELDMNGAWRVLGRSLMALFHALATVVLVLGRLAGNDLRAAWRALVGLVRGRHEDDEDFDTRHDDDRD